MPSGSLPGWARHSPRPRPFHLASGLLCSSASWPKPTVFLVAKEAWHAPCSCWLWRAGSAPGRVSKLSRQHYAARSAAHWSPQNIYPIEEKVHMQLTKEIRSQAARFFSVAALAVLLSVGLAACGGDTSSSATSPTATTAP